MAKRKKKSEPVEREVELINGQQGPKPRKRLKMDPERQQYHNQIIETIRQMLRENWTTGDIKRAIRSQYDLKHRQCLVYLKHARERNVQLLDRTEDEVTAYSIGYWSRKQRDCGERIMHAKKRIQEAEREMETANAVIESENATQERKELAVEQLKISAKKLEDARKTIYSAEMMSSSYQDRLDRILAPGKYNRRENAEVTKEGQNVNQPAPEPINNELQDRRVEEMLARLTGKAEPKTPDQT